MTLNAYLNRFRSVKRSNRAMSWNAWDISTALFPVLRVFWRNNMASAVEIPVENPWKWHFRDSKFQNVPRRLDPKKLEPLVLVPKPPTIHDQPPTWKLFDSPAQDDFFCFIPPSLTAKYEFQYMGIGLLISGHLVEGCLIEASLYLSL